MTSSRTAMGSPAATHKKGVRGYRGLGWRRIALFVGGTDATGGVKGDCRGRQCQLLCRQEDVSQVLADAHEVFAYCHDRDLLQPSSTHSRALSTIPEPTSSIPEPHSLSRLRTPVPDHARSLPTRSGSTRSLVPISR